ncbi:MAG TPA: hypothetical protein VHW00_15285 [Thermoanaerobaculia bacterium]|nr:hypothetical protein [Thermoanaerobaculia bacterium]
MTAIVSPMLWAAPVLRFSGSKATVDGLTPGGTVAIFCVALEPIGAPPVPTRTREMLLLHDDDRNSAVVLDHTRPIPAISVWVVVDIETGQRTIAGGPGYEPLLMPLGEVAKRDNAGQLRKLSAALGEVELMVVRPGVGAWSLYAAKTSRFDESRRDEPLRVDIGSMIPAGDTPAAPNALRQGDIVTVIDPYTMRVFVTEVGQ